MHKLARFSDGDSYGRTLDTEARRGADRSERGAAGAVTDSTTARSSFTVGRSSRFIDSTIGRSFTAGGVMGTREPSQRSQSRGHVAGAVRRHGLNRWSCPCGD